MTSNDDVRILGTLRAADGKGLVRMEDRFDADIRDVWSALTDRARLASWLGVVEGDLHAGGEFRARFYASGWEGTGRVQECEPLRRLLVLTKGDGELDEGPIEISLVADGHQTTVVWEERGMPLDLLAGYGAGIQIHLEDLGDHVAGRGRRDAKKRFGALFPAYGELASECTA